MKNAFAVFIMTLPALAIAWDPRSLAPLLGDPRLMRSDFATNPYSETACSCEFPHIELAQETSGYTYVTWARMATNFISFLPIISARIFFSAHDARTGRDAASQRENGGTIGNWTNVVLDSNGTWTSGSSGVVSPRDLSHDEYLPTDGITNFHYGVWVLNIISNTAPVTLSIAGSEINIPAGDRWIRNAEGISEDGTVSITGTPGATLKLGINELIPIKFYYRVNGVTEEGTACFTKESNVTNAWVFISYRICISNGCVWSRDDLMHWSGDDPSGQLKNEGPTTASRFELGAMIHPGLTGICSPCKNFQTFGTRFYSRVLSDSEITLMRDLDEAEMKRRGYSENYE